MGWVGEEGLKGLVLLCPSIWFYWDRTMQFTSYVF